MDYEIHNRLVTLLLMIPDIGNFDTRTDLLTGIPNRSSLSRSQTERTDISRLIDQLAKMRLQKTGKLALTIFIDNAILRVEGTVLNEDLKNVRLELEVSLGQTEPTASPSSTAQSTSQFPVSDSTSISQASPSRKRASGSSFAHGYALIIGIARYSDARIGELSVSIVKDAMEMHTILRSEELCGYQDSHVKILDNNLATAANIRDSLKWLAQVANTDKEATVLFYFSGHGGRVEIDSQTSHYLIPYDCNLDDLEDTALSGTELTQLLHDIQVPRLLTLLDHCYSGGIDEIKEIGRSQNVFKEGTEEDYYQQLAQGKGRFIIASSRSTETSRSSSKMNNSLFTHYLLEALRGKAHTLGDGLIRVYEISSYVTAQVSKHRPQHPVMSARASDNFPIALYLGGKETNLNTDQSQRISMLSVDQPALREAIVRAFTLEELRELCTNITQALRSDGRDELISPDLLEGTGLRGKIQSLIEYLDRRDYLSYLITELCKARPNLDVCK